MEETKRCPHCMSPTDLNICPHCNKNTTDQNPEDALPVGTVLAGKFFVGILNNQGVQGMDYNGFDLETNSSIIIKEFFPQSLSSRAKDGSTFVADKNLVSFKSLLYDYTDMLKNISDVQSDKLIEIYDIVFERGTGYGIIENCTTPTLADYINNSGGSISVIETKKIILQLCGALACVHGLGFIHGSISPQNIRFDEIGTLKLVGFSTISLRLLHSSFRKTEPQSYTAPEQLDTNQWEGSWTDVYAVAALFYYMLTGHNVPIAKQRLLADKYIPLHMYDSEIPKNIAETVDNALELDPEKRISSIEEFTAGILQTQKGSTAVFSVKINETLFIDDQTRVIGVAPIVTAETRIEKVAKPNIKSKKLSIIAMSVAAVAIVGFILFYPEINTNLKAETPKLPLPEARLVPSLEGRHIDSIRSNMQWNEEFDIIIKYVYNEKLYDGIIVDQAPDPGVKMINKGTVILTVSKGSQKIGMPNLIGSSVDFALRTLSEMEIPFVVIEKDEFQDGIVGGSNFGPDELVDKVTDKVEVYIGMRQISSISLQPSSPSSSEEQSSDYEDD